MYEFRGEKMKLLDRYIMADIYRTRHIISTTQVVTIIGRRKIYQI